MRRLPLQHEVRHARIPRDGMLSPSSMTTSRGLVVRAAAEAVVAAATPRHQLALLASSSSILIHLCDGVVTCHDSPLIEHLFARANGYNSGSLITESATNYT